jgi:hypothetical protein
MVRFEFPSAQGAADPAGIGFAAGADSNRGVAVMAV